MENIIQMQPEDLKPSVNDVFEAQGMKSDYNPSKRIHSILEKALDDFLILAKPRGIFSEISSVDFHKIYAGHGLNHEKAPLKNIYPAAERMALYAITMGTEVSKFIESIFKNNDYALGYMLDTVASLGTNNAAELMEKQYAALDLDSSSTSRVLAYSPGYCGWHISGQKQLFNTLKPESIGITLNSSFLMTPLKSITGLLVQGPEKIHNFKPGFPFCSKCLTRSCLERINNKEAN